MVEYYIKQLAKPRNALGRFSVAKFDGDEAPAAIYYVTIHLKTVECTCPAYTKPDVKPIACKHAVMVARWVLEGQQVHEVFLEKGHAKRKATLRQKV